MDGLLERLFGWLEPYLDPVATVILWSTIPIFLWSLAMCMGTRWRERVRGWLYGATWSRAYAGLLTATLDRLHRFFGPPLSWQAFERCFALAVVYALVLLFVTFVLEDAEDGERGATLIGLGLGLSAAIPVYLLFRWVRRRHLRGRAGAGRARRVWLHLREQAIYFLSGAVLFFGAIVAAAIAVATGVIAIVVAGAAAAAAAGVVAAAAAAAGAGAGAGVVAIFFAAMFIAIPLLNALFDMPSWAASRWMMGRLAADAARPDAVSRGGAILAHLALDLILAVICLFGLAIVIANFAHGIDIVIANFAHGIDIPMVWRNYSAARAMPFDGVGRSMTVMLLSTLVPTAIHLFFAVFALAVLRMPFANRVAFMLQEPEQGGSGNEPATQILAALYLTWCAVFALIVLWGAGSLALWGLDGLVDGTPGAFWRAIFDTADRLILF